jgi:N-formylmaleamate deformylase
MNHWNSFICQTNNINLHYTRTGANKPPLILLHGLMTNGICWTSLANTLQHDYDVIMPDARGHGNSSVPDHGYGYDDHAKDVVGLIKSLGISAPILLGHSMGGMTAAVVASQHPNLLQGLILADPTFLSPKLQREVRDSEVADQHRRILKKSLNELIADAQKRNPNRSLETLKLLALARLQTSMSAFDVLTPPNPDYKMLVSEINIPILLIFGDKGIVTTSMAAELQGLNAKLQIYEIHQAGHSIHLEQPENFAAVVKSFLDSL